MTKKNEPEFLKFKIWDTFLLLDDEMLEGLSCIGKLICLELEMLF